MATTATSTLVKHYYGTYAIYNASKSSFADGIYICTDTGQLFVKGIEVRDKNALTSVTNYGLKSVEYDQSTRKLTVTQEDGTSKAATLPDATAANATGYGLLSAEDWGDLSSNVTDALTRLETAETNITTAQSTADAAKSAAATAQSGVDAINSAKAKAGGFASLDTDGKVPSTQLPSYVDDVLEYDYKDSTEKGTATSGTTFPATGEAGKIYVSKKTNLTYRWSGSAYVEISPSLALGETSSTAYAGDKGKKLREDVDTAIKTIADGVGGGTTVTLTTTTVGGTTGSVTIPEASSSGSGTAGVVSGATAKAIVANTASRVKNVTNTPAASAVKVTIDLNTATDVSTDLPAATQSEAGVMTATDKKNLDDTKDAWDTFDANEKITALDYDTSTHTLSLKRGGDNTSLAALEKELPLATTSAAGVMSATDKTNLEALKALSVWYQAT